VNIALVGLITRSGLLLTVSVTGTLSDPLVVELEVIVTAPLQTVGCVIPKTLLAKTCTVAGVVNGPC
jgi:hypothetical protein